MQRWDLFCRVVDNYGDAGVCWRLARQLAREHPLRVRLWIDQLEPLALLCPGIDAQQHTQVWDGVEVRLWPMDFPEINTVDVDVADVVIEAFACDLPPRYLAALSGPRVPPGQAVPLWINLEYLSAESWVEECHLLPSPRAQGQVQKFFFFPGFTRNTGGLLRERTLEQHQHQFDSVDRVAWWQKSGLPVPAAGEQTISLLCYDNPVLPALLDCWAKGTQPVRLLVAAGAPTRQVQRWLDHPMTGRDQHTGTETTTARGSLTICWLPFLPQTEYDRLLWASDINFVRGEDSFVRAQWAQQPFVWQIYPQADGAHLIKLDAFLSLFLAENRVEPTIAQAVRHWWQMWNGGANRPASEVAQGWQNFAAQQAEIRQQGKAWSGQLEQTGNLADNLVSFVQTRTVPGSFIHNE